jgi:hemolysin III
MDKCAIYILIAGSYTPFMQILLSDQPIYSFGLLGFIWMCAILGISVEAMYPNWKRKKIFSLIMYLGMGVSYCMCEPPMNHIIANDCLIIFFFHFISRCVFKWSCVMCLPQMVTRLHAPCALLIILGGIAYTAGVPWFVRNNNLDHAIWHLFVLSGSMLHWIAIYWYVASTPLKTAGADGSSFGIPIHDAIMSFIQTVV